MKGNHTKISTQIFNFRLFLEALKRLRVIGLATAILSLTASALVPVVTWLEYDYKPGITYDVETEFLCVPVGFVTFLAPFFFFVLFSFLQKRKESDFFHSIPYTRTCVYISFVAAALAFVWAIQIACGLTAGILWTLIPGLILDLGGLALYVLICLLATAMLSSFMMLALTVSGTPGSCMLLFGLFAGFVRVVVTIWGGCISNIDLLSMDGVWMDTFISPLWFLPISILYYFPDIDAAARVMYSLPNILYTILVTLAVYALAGLIYKRRKSEMAGSPAPGTKTQALFRILFTLLPTLLIPLFLIQGTDDPSLHLILVVVVLLVYFLYELITTKRPRNMLKAIPGLGIVAACCILFFLAYAGYRNVVLNEQIDADEIKTVSVAANGLGPQTYQGRILGDFQTDDPEVVQIVADQLAEAQKAERNGRYGDYYWNRTTATLRLKNGRTVRREIILLDEDVESIFGNLKELDAIRDVLYCLPTDRDIESGGIHFEITSRHSDYCHFYNDLQMQELMAVFREEFQTLTDEQKNRIMAPTLHYYDWTEAVTGITFTLRGEVNGQYFHSEYVVTDDMPRTRNYLLTAWLKETYNHYQGAGSEWSGTSSEILTQFLSNLEDPDFTEVHKNVTLALYATSIQDREGSGKSYEHEYIRVETEKLPELIWLLLKRDLWRTEEKPKEGIVTINENTYCVRISLEGDHKEYARLYLECSGLYDLTAEDWQTICDILGIKNTMK